MLKRSAFVLLALCTLGLQLHAQSGCVNSPENPTAILGLLGIASAWALQRRQR